MLFKFIFQTMYFKKSDENENYDFSEFKLLTIDNEKDIKDLYGGDRSIYLIGAYYVDCYRDGPLFYAELPVKNIGVSHQIADMVTDSIEWALRFLWIIKDNSCNLLGTVYIPQDNTPFILKKDLFVSNAEGNHVSESFSISEWHEAIEYFHKYREITKKKFKNNLPKLKLEEQEIEGAHLKSTDFQDYNSFNRIERAMLFLLQARGTVFLPAKISFYVLVLESLFSANDLGEIKYKIGLRIAVFLGGTNENKRKNFDFVQLTYRVRSKYLHGQMLESKARKEEDLILISKQLDDLLRSIMQSILNEPEPFMSSNTEELANWFNDQTFPIMPITPVTPDPE